MAQIIEKDRTNKAYNKDRLEVSKDLEINAYLESPFIMTRESSQIFTKQDFERALKKASRRLDKRESKSLQQ